MKAHSLAFTIDRFFPDVFWVYFGHDCSSLISVVSVNKKPSGYAGKSCQQRYKCSKLFRKCRTQDTVFMSILYYSPSPFPVLGLQFGYNLRPTTVCQWLRADVGTLSDECGGSTTAPGTQLGFLATCDVLPPPPWNFQPFVKGGFLPKTVETWRSSLS